VPNMNCRDIEYEAFKTAYGTEWHWAVGFDDKRRRVGPVQLVATRLVVQSAIDRDGLSTTAGVAVSQSVLARGSGGNQRKR
jgi:hypothetical protein